MIKRYFRNNQTNRILRISTNHYSPQFLGANTEVTENDYNNQENEVFVPTPNPNIETARDKLKTLGFTDDEAEVILRR